jgi:hypothetical protein
MLLQLGRTHVFPTPVAAIDREPLSCVRLRSGQEPFAGLRQSICNDSHRRQVALDIPGAEQPCLNRPYVRHSAQRTGAADSTSVTATRLPATQVLTIFRLKRADKVNKITVTPSSHD